MKKEIRGEGRRNPRRLPSPPSPLTAASRAADEHGQGRRKKRSRGGGARDRRRRRRQMEKGGGDFDDDEGEYIYVLGKITIYYPIIYS